MQLESDTLLHTSKFPLPQTHYREKAGSGGSQQTASSALAHANYAARAAKKRPQTQRQRSTCFGLWRAASGRPSPRRKVGLILLFSVLISQDGLDCHCASV